MAIRKYSLAVPMTRQSGDEFRFVGKRIEQWVGAVKVDERDLSQEASVILEQQEAFGAATVQSVLLEVSMPGVVATLTGVSINQGTGALTASWSDGSGEEFADWADFVDKNGSLDTDNSFAKKVLLNKLLRITPDGSNLDALNGSSCTIDGNAVTPVQTSLTV